MAVFVNSGIGAQLVMIPESTYGVAPALSGTTLMPFEFDSETLELKKIVVQGKGLHAGGLHNRAARRVVTNYEAGGGINMDLPTRYLNGLLMQMFGSKGSAASVLTVNGATTTYSATHAPGSLKGSSLTIQKGVPSVDGTAPNPFTYVGCKLSDWEVSVATGSIAKLVLNVAGRNELAGSGNGDPLNGSVPGLATFTEAVTNDVFHFRQATILTGGTPSTTSGVTSIAGGTAAGNVKSANIKYAFKYDDARYFIGSAGFKAEPIENDFRTVSGNLEIEWLNSEAMYNAFAADTPTALALNFVGKGIGTGGTQFETLDFIIPNIYLDGEAPKVPGTAVIVQKIPFTGLDDGTNNVIQANYTTLDAT